MFGMLFAAPSAAKSDSAPRTLGKAHFCQCVEFALNYFYNGKPLGVGGPWDNAYQMATSEYWNNRREDSIHRTATNTPAPGTVVIFGPAVNGFDSKAGHIGVVMSAQQSSAGWTIQLRSSNTSGTRFVHSSCDNVSDRSVFVAHSQIRLTNFATGVSFWKKPCPYKTKGDADCNTKVNLIDYEVWRQEYTKQRSTRTADFDNDGVVSLVDYEIWRRNYLGT